MNPDAAQLADLAWGPVTAAFAVFLRVGAAMAVLPGFGDSRVPMRVRLVLALAFTAVVYPATATDVAAMAARPGAWIVTEPLIGLAISLALRLLVISLVTAGGMVAQSTSLAQLFAGAETEPQPAIAQLLVSAALALAMIGGLHVRVAKLLILSYAALPPGRMPSASVLSDWGVARVSASFSLAFSIAVPFVIAALVYNLALGAINRAMPQLMVSLIGAPLAVGGTLVLLALASPTALALWHEALAGFAADPFAVPP